MRSCGALFGWEGGAGLGRHRHVVFAKDTPGNIGAEFFATDRAVGRPFNGRAVLSRHASFWVAPLPYGGLGHAEKRCKGHL